MIETLQQCIEDAVAAFDLEQAGRCCDMTSAMRGGATAAEADEADLVGLKRQDPGAIGLGTSSQRMTPPVGWCAPLKPDPMTVGCSTRRRRSS